MDVKEAIIKAKEYINEIYQSEQVTNLGLEEIVHSIGSNNWEITLGFSQPWNTPRTRAQEVLENLGATVPLKRSYKVITMSDDGIIYSMRNHERAGKE